MSISDAPPRVTGRHRNRALSAARRRQAVELALAGVTYQAIAEQMGYASRGTVYRIVQSALRGQIADTVDELRGLELDRLDALQAAHWEAALQGDRAAGLLVLRVSERRCRLLGLYSEGSSSAVAGAQVSARKTVVVDPSELVAQHGWPMR